MAEAKTIRLMRVIESEQGEHAVTVTVAAQEGRHSIIVPRESIAPFVDALQRLGGGGHMSKPPQLSVEGHAAAREQNGDVALKLNTDVGEIALAFPPGALSSLIDSLRQIRDDELPPFGH